MSSPMDDDTSAYHLRLPNQHHSISLSPDSYIPSHPAAKGLNLHVHHSLSTSPALNDDLNSSYIITSNGTLRSQGFAITPNGITEVPAASSRPSSAQIHPLQQHERSSSSAASFAASSSSSSSSSLPGSAAGARPSSAQETLAGGESFRHDEFVELGCVGKGACGSVRRALHLPSLRIVALKTVPIYDKSKRRQFLRELSSLLAISSPFIVTVYGAFHHDGQLTLVLEYMNRLSLSSCLQLGGAFPIQLVQHVAYSMLHALLPLHEARMIHRDIKPGNILLNRSGDVKLADFGVLTSLEGTRDMAQTYIGTVIFMSPERISNEPYTVSSDIWSLGLTILYLATGQRPYEAEANGGYFSLLQAICHGPPPRAPPNFPPEFQQFIAMCLEKSPQARASVKQLLTCDFIRTHDHVYAHYKKDFTTYKTDPNDLNDIESVVQALIKTLYANCEYKASLFDEARFEKIASQLNIDRKIVKSIFERTYKEYKELRNK